MNIHILATCRKPELLDATTLVFKSLRVGFPNANVYVSDNNLSREHREVIHKHCKDIGARLFLTRATIHHEWIESLVEHNYEPFIILDTDITFWDNCEGWSFDTAIAGRCIPPFIDPFSKCITMRRLHGSFLYVDPSKLKMQVEKYKNKFPQTPFTPVTSLFNPLIIPHVGQSIFFDTCAFLYHAIGGAEFTHEQLDCYDHLNCGTISDIVSPHLTDINMSAAHKVLLNTPSLMKGIWREQDAWYAAHAI